MGQFQPKIVECMKHYSKNQLVKDIFAGILVAVIAFPLSVALAISSGLSPEKGLYSAIIGGFFVSLFGGSKVNIGGITAATVMTVFTIVDEYGLAGLAAASIMAGVILILMGLFRLGGLLKYIPRTITLGFTAAIGVGIFTNQIKGFFGLQIETVPVKFLEKMPALFGAVSTFQPAAVLVGAASIVILLVLPKINDIYGIKFETGEEHINISSADFLDAQILNIEPGSPIFVNTRTAHCSLGPMEYLEARIRPDPVSYTHLIRSNKVRTLCRAISTLGYFNVVMDG